MILRIILLLCYSIFFRSNSILTYNEQNSIILTEPIYSFKQLKDSKILIQYQNSSFILYESNFTLIKIYQNINNLGLIEHYQFSPDETFLTIIKPINSPNTDPYNLYYFHLTNNSLSKINIISNKPILLFVENRILQKYILVIQRYKARVMGLDYIQFFQFSYPLYEIQHCTIGISNPLLQTIYCSTNNYQIILLTLICSSGYFSQMTVQIFQSYSSTNKILNFFYEDNILVVQLSNLQIKTYYQGVEINLSQNFQQNQLIGFTTYSGNFYYIFDNQLYVGIMQGDSSTNYILNFLSINPITLNENSQITTSYNNNLGFTNFIIDKNMSKLYKLNQCSNGQFYINGECTFIPCTVSQCQICYFSPNLCSKCINKSRYVVQSLINSCKYTLCPQFCKFCNIISAEVICNSCLTGYILSSDYKSCNINNSSSTNSNFSDNTTNNNSTTGSQTNSSTNSTTNSTTNSITNSTTNSTTNSNSTTTTNNITNGSNQTNNIPSNQNNTNNNDLNSKQASNNIHNCQDYNSNEIRIGCIAFRSFNYFPGLRQYFPFLLPFFSFFDDYWYYLYQRNTMDNLQSIPQFFILMYLVSKNRLFPDFNQNFQYLEKFVTVNQQTVNQYQSFTHFKVLQIDQQPTYFWYNSRGFIIYQLIFITIVTLFIKFILFVFNFFDKWILKHQGKVICQQLHRKAKSSQIKQQKDISQKLKINILKKCVIQYLKERSKLKQFIECLFSGSLIFFSFQIGLQMKMIGQYQFITKINVNLMLIFGFFILIYSIVFNLNNQFIFNQKITNKFRFRNDNIKNILLFSMKNVLIGFLQGFLINANLIQLICLILVKTTILISIFYLIFKSKILKLIKIMYMILSILVDLILILSGNGFLTELIQKGTLSLEQINNIQLIILILMLSFVVLNVICDVTIEIHKFYKQNFNTKKSKYAEEKISNKQNLKKIITQIKINNVIKQNKKRISIRKKTKFIKIFRFSDNKYTTQFVQQLINLKK